MSAAAMRDALCIVPPYRHRSCPPAAAAALLGYLKAHGHRDVRFLDLRLHAPEVLMPTFDPVGVFGESFVIDVPDLPLVLRVLRASDERRDGPLIGERDAGFDAYCLERGMDPARLHRWLVGMDAFTADAFAPFPSLRFLGMSTWSSNLLTSLMAAAHLKRRPSPPFIVVGGPQVTESRASALLGLRAGLFDAVVLGEGELALREVYEAFGRGVTAGVPGTLARGADGAVVAGGDRALLRLRELPLPDFSEMAVAAYRSSGGLLRLPFQLSRGCTDECSFCSEWVFWRHFRPDTVDHAVEQIAELASRWGVHDFHFTDSLINGHPGRLRGFAEAVLRRNLRVSWGGFMRAQMDPETAALIRRAGCTYAYVGIESLSDETLELMNKRRTEADNLRAVRAFLDAGIAVSAGVIPGFPGDTRARLLRTARILSGLAEAHPGVVSFNVEPFVVSPGQPIFAELERFGLTAHPWPDEVLDLAPRYRDVTGTIARHVEGANQGVERLGQLRVLHTLFVGRRTSPAETILDRAEALPDDRLQLVRVSGGHLALAKRRGRVVGLLVTPRERAECEQAVAEVGGGALLDDPAVAAWWRRIEERHAWSSDGGLRPARFAADLALARELAIPAHVIGRRLRGRLVVASVLSTTAVVAPSWAEELLVWLAARPRATAAIARKLRALGVAGPAWERLGSRLVAGGLVQITALVEAPAMRPAALRVI